MVGSRSSTNFCSTRHVVGRYSLPRCLISLLFRTWALLACSDPAAQKSHHLVGTCCSATSLRFSHSAVEAFIPTHFAQELFWEVRPTWQQRQLRAEWGKRREMAEQQVPAKFCLFLSHRVQESKKAHKGHASKIMYLKINRHATVPSQPGFPTQLLGKKMQVASPIVILHIHKPLKHFPIQNGRD